MTKPDYTLGPAIFSLLIFQLSSRDFPNSNQEISLAKASFSGYNYDDQLNL
jgi:hypothetical protein